MSRYGWERATITLPSISVPRLRESLNASTNALHNQALSDARRFWKDYAKQTRSPKLYAERLETFLKSLSPSVSPYSWHPTPSKYSDDALEGLRWMLESVSSHPHQLTVVEVSKHFPRASNRTTSWQVGHEGHIALRGRIVTWSTSDGNHSVERAHETAIAKTFFGFLSKVVWTRGTGGTGVGNDEYNTDNAYEGGGANYETFRYGPLGNAQFIAANGWDPKTGRIVRPHQPRARKVSPSKAPASPVRVISSVVF